MKRRDILEIEAFVHVHDEELAIEAGAMHAITRRQGLPLADRACLALARRLAATALTTDRPGAGLTSASRSR
jgi:PIN domain nuclease of toxin-antitoxin system